MLFHLALEHFVVAQVFGLLVERGGDHHHRRVRAKVGHLVPHPWRHVESPGRVVEPYRFLDGAIVEMCEAATIQRDEDELRFAMPVATAPLSGSDMVQPEDASRLEVETLAHLQEIDAAAR